MKIKGVIAVLLALLCIFALTGCQLALEDAGEARSNDRLIGTLITSEYLDLFDFEGYLKDNIGKISTGGEIYVNGNQEKYEGRLYAVLKEREWNDEDTGEKSTTEEYVFEDVEGVSYFAATITEKNSSITYITTGSDEAISDGHTGIIHGDDEEKITLEGTIYISATQGVRSHYINPVYQSPDGRVYAISGQGLTMSGDQGEGAAFSQTLDEAITETENGKSKKLSTSIKISLETVFPPERIVILEMDENSSLLSNEKYSSGEVPDKLTPKEETAYIIIETHKKDNNGTALVTRELFSRKDETLSTFFCRKDGICIKRWTQLIWE